MRVHTSTGLFREFLHLNGGNAITDNAAKDLIRKSVFRTRYSSVLQRLDEIGIDFLSYQTREPGGNLSAEILLIIGLDESFYVIFLFHELDTIFRHSVFFSILPFLSIT